VCAKGIGSGRTVRFVSGGGVLRADGCADSIPVAVIAGTVGAFVVVVGTMVVLCLMLRKKRRLRLQREAKRSLRKKLRAGGGRAKKKMFRKKKGPSKDKLKGKTSK
jgi:hypothetical protein